MACRELAVRDRQHDRVGVEVGEEVGRVVAQAVTADRGPGRQQRRGPDEPVRSKKNGSERTPAPGPQAVRGANLALAVGEAVDDGAPAGQAAGAAARVLGDLELLVAGTVLAPVGGDVRRVREVVAVPVDVEGVADVRPEVAPEQVDGRVDGHREDGAIAAIGRGEDVDIVDVAVAVFRVGSDLAVGGGPAEGGGIEMVGRAGEERRGADRQDDERRPERGEFAGNHGGSDLPVTTGVGGLLHGARPISPPRRRSRPPSGSLVIRSACRDG